MFIKESLLLVVLVTLCYLTGRAHSKRDVCPVGWTKRGNMCYKYDARKVGYAMAQRICKTAGGDLAMPKTRAEIKNVIAVRTSSKRRKDHVWIGLDDIKNEGKFVWNDGTSLAGGKKSPFWRKRQPNNAGTGEDCGQLWAKKKRFDDVRCNYNKNSIVCQKAVGPVTMTMVRRVSGNVNFHETWAAYEKGFGDCQTGDCWLGLKALHNLCMENCKLQVTMAYKGKKYHADYTMFTVGPQSDNYRMKIGGYSGNAGDSMSINNDGQFSTKDRENDQWKKHCSQVFTGGWWYKACHHAHPTGTWGSKEMGKGINWKTVTTHDDSLSSITMKVTQT